MTMHVPAQHYGAWAPNSRIVMGLRIWCIPCVCLVMWICRILLALLVVCAWVWTGAHDQGQVPMTKDNTLLCSTINAVKPFCMVDPWESVALQLGVTLVLTVTQVYVFVNLRRATSVPL